MKALPAIAIGVGLVGAAVAGGLFLAGCEKNANEFAVDEFGKFDQNPTDNKWTQHETTLGFRETPPPQLVETYRVGEARIGTWQYLERNRTESMGRVFEAARGNDAVLSLDELTNFAISRFDSDRNGTLSGGERNAFNGTYGIARTYTPWVVTRTAPYIDLDYYRQYPTNPGTGGTSGGDDHGTGGTSGGDDGGTYVPPNNGGGYVPPSNGGDTGGGDDGGSDVPPSTPPSNNNGNSTDNGNPVESDF